MTPDAMARDPGLAATDSRCRVDVFLDDGQHPDVLFL
jgi:hypothetical protein